jgi:hypothetical protein
MKSFLLGQPCSELKPLPSQYPACTSIYEAPDAAAHHGYPKSKPDPNFCFSQRNQRTPLDSEDFYGKTHNACWMPVVNPPDIPHTSGSPVFHTPHNAVERANLIRPILSYIT